MKFINFFRHLHTVNKHRFCVFVHACKVGIFFKGLVHDLSKYSYTEFFNSAKYYTGYQSPTIKERNDKGYSDIWMHHKGRNKHHFEYWNDLDMKDHMYKSVKMPIKYVKEMFCDRIAACKIYLGKNYNDSSALNYFISKKAKDLMYPDTAILLEKWLRYLSINGEKKTFKMIRKEKNY